MLIGATALVVEDEYLIALEIQRILETAGASAILIARTVAEGSAETVSRRFDVAFVSIGPDNHAALDLCRLLQGAGVAVVVVSSVAEHRYGLPGFPTAQTVIKPFTDTDILEAATAALARRATS